jgi:xanthine dehydrogenase FAD-binding subunit
MNNINYYFEPESIKEAYILINEYPGARFIAGGTDLLLKCKKGSIENATLVSLGQIEELRIIEKRQDGTVFIGAMNTFDDLMKSQIIRKELPVIVTAASTLAGPQIRNVATIGGNICNGATSADSAPTLFALETELCISSANGQRWLPIEEFYLGPSKVALLKGEILKGFRIKLPPQSKTIGHYIKFSPRKAMDISMLGCAVACQIDNENRMDNFRIALGTAGPTPIRCKKAEEIAFGRSISNELLIDIVNAASLEANPRSSWRASKEYRTELIKEITRRTVLEVLYKIKENS